MTLASQPTAVDENLAVLSTWTVLTTSRAEKRIRSGNAFPKIPNIIKFFLIFFDAVDKQQYFQEDHRPAMLLETSLL